VEHIEAVDILDTLEFSKKADNFGAPEGIKLFLAARSGTELWFEDFNGKEGFANAGFKAVCFTGANFEGLGTGFVLAGCSLNLCGCFSFWLGRLRLILEKFFDVALGGLANEEVAASTSCLLLTLMELLMGASE